MRADCQGASARHRTKNERRSNDRVLRRFVGLVNSIVPLGRPAGRRASDELPTCGAGTGGGGGYFDAGVAHKIHTALSARSRSPIVRCTGEGARAEPLGAPTVKRFGVR